MLPRNRIQSKSNYLLINRLLPKNSVRRRAAKLAIKIIRSAIKPKQLYHELKNIHQATHFNKIRKKKFNINSQFPHSHPLLTMDGEKIREFISTPPPFSLLKDNEKNCSSDTNSPLTFSLIILNKNAPQFIIPLLESLKGTGLNKNYQVIVGDTGTTNQKVLGYYKKNKPNFKVIRNLEYHFCKNYNFLVQNYACGKIIGIINNDIILPKLYFLKEISDAFANAAVGIVGTKLLYEDGRLQHGGMFFLERGKYRGLPYHRFHGDSPDNLPGKTAEIIPAVTGAFMFCRRNDFISFSGFDENYQEEAQDADLCLKFHRSGMKVLFLHSPHIIHIENGTRPKGSENWQDRNYFSWKWNAFLESSILGTNLNKIHMKSDTQNNPKINKSHR